jgi:hypothetical protein
MVADMIAKGELDPAEAADAGAALFNMCGACAVTVSDGVAVGVEHVGPVRVDGQPHAFALGQSSVMTPILSYVRRDRRRAAFTVVSRG